MQRMISTIGYEGATIERFLKVLSDVSIGLLIDVRQVPLSRKSGFSKNKLAEILSAHGIAYVHLRGLGDPKPGREAARAGDFARFLRIYRLHLHSEDAQRDLATASELVQTHHACLMCFEADHETCHRTIVADHLAEITGLHVCSLSATTIPVRRLAA